MTCYICSRGGNAAPAVAVCIHCGAGLCMTHFVEAQSASVAGMKYTCPHMPLGAAAKKAR
jgi:hypothetical protein